MDEVYQSSIGLEETIFEFHIVTIDDIDGYVGLVGEFLDKFIPGAEKTLQALGCGFFSFYLPDDVIRMLCADLSDEGQHEVVFAGEVVVDGAFRKTSGCGDFVDVGANVAFLGELFGGSSEKFLTGIQADFISRFGRGAGHKHLYEYGWAVTHIILGFR
jgi:hypothetical protein